VRQKKGFTVSFFSPELAIARVQQRVKAGGHNVPEETTRRRYASGPRNYEGIYKPIVDEWMLYDHSFTTPNLIEEGVNQ
jgi:predicted ABC-type ATPase